MWCDADVDVWCRQDLLNRPWRISDWLRRSRSPGELSKKNYSVSDPDADIQTCVKNADPLQLCPASLDDPAYEVGDDEYLTTTPV